MLTRAGVGRLEIVDRDFVEPSNLQRQSLFTEEDALKAVPKAAAAEEALGAINSEAEIRGHVLDLAFDNIEALCRSVDVIVDATDNFETRYLINDFSVKHSIPWVYGGCVGSCGVAFAFQPGSGPCLQCLFPERPEPGSMDTCDTAGIIAPAVHAVAAFQTTQTLKLLTGAPVEARIFQFDVWECWWRAAKAPGKGDPECRCCGLRQFRFLDGERQDRLVRLCGRNAIQVFPAAASVVDFQRLAARLNGVGRTVVSEYMMRIEVDGYEIALFPDGRSIIKGTDDPSRARAVYARYIGR